MLLLSKLCGFVNSKAIQEDDIILLACGRYVLRFMICVCHAYLVWPMIEISFHILLQKLVVTAVSLAIARDGASGGVVRTVTVSILCFMLIHRPLHY